MSHQNCGNLSFSCPVLSAVRPLTALYRLWTTCTVSWSHRRPLVTRSIGGTLHMRATSSICLLTYLHLEYGLATSDNIWQYLEYGLAISSNIWNMDRQTVILHKPVSSITPTFLDMSIVNTYIGPGITRFTYDKVQNQGPVFKPSHLSFWLCFT